LSSSVVGFGLFVFVVPFCLFASCLGLLFLVFLFFGGFLFSFWFVCSFLFFFFLFVLFCFPVFFFTFLFLFFLLVSPFSPDFSVVLYCFFFSFFVPLCLFGACYVLIVSILAQFGHSRLYFCSPRVSLS